MRSCGLYPQSPIPNEFLRPRKHTEESKRNVGKGGGYKAWLVQIPGKQGWYKGYWFFICCWW